MANETELEDEEYPSVRKALFGNGHVANLRCAIKYVVWQVGYILLAVVGALIIGAMMLFDFIGQSRVADWLGRANERVTSSQKAKKASRIGGNAALVGMLLVMVGWMVYMAITSPLVFGASVLAAIVLLGLALGGAALLDGLEQRHREKMRQQRLSDEEPEPGRVRKTTSAITSKAKETPGVRRVYGNCPVHWDIEPKWFEKISEK